MKQLDLSSTIVAVSSGIAPARRAIVRLSGQNCGGILQSLLPSSYKPLTDASSATRFEAKAEVSFRQRKIHLPVACHWWPDDRCFTGQPSAELHLLGSLPLVELLIEETLRHGARPAEPGEFTLRSFMAGKIDLTQAEAVLGVIEADQDRELELALGQLGGNISAPVRQLRMKLMEVTSHLEAGLDFVEEDIEFITREDLVSQLSEIQEQIRNLADRLVSRGTRSRLPTVVLIGLPNAGKSTLFNLILGESRAIVSKQAGTTRDAVSAEVRFDDIRAELVDTAGIEELTEHSPRHIAQTVLHTRLELADLVVFCIAANELIDMEWIAQQLERLPPGIPRLLVATKSAVATLDWDQADIAVDQSDPRSVERLKDAIADALARTTKEFHSSAMHLTLMRCRDGLLHADTCLRQAIDQAAQGLGEELVASELRLALDALGNVIGEVHTEDILGQIFSRFCIGK